MTGFAWTCPHCGRHTTITAPNVDLDSLSIYTKASAKDEGIDLKAQLIVCPAPGCGKLEFQVFAHFGTRAEDTYGMPVKGVKARPVGIGAFKFLPQSAAPLSEWVPSFIKDDYSEAYLIRSLSPKASATLARRALQGMIRDFWSFSKSTLHAELEAIQDKCDPHLYDAMMKLKAIGNIGAHPGRDVSVITEIFPGEPEMLLELLHLLDREWYVARADRAARLSRVKAWGTDSTPPSK